MLAVAARTGSLGLRTVLQPMGLLVVDVVTGLAAVSLGDDMALVQREIPSHGLSLALGRRLLAVAFAAGLRTCELAPRRALVMAGHAELVVDLCQRAHVRDPLGASDPPDHLPLLLGVAGVAALGAAERLCVAIVVELDKRPLGLAVLPRNIDENDRRAGSPRLGALMTVPAVTAARQERDEPCESDAEAPGPFGSDLGHVLLDPSLCGHLWCGLPPTSYSPLM
jgi:hypothetical protein